MNLSYFIGKRLLWGTKESFTRLIVRLAIASVAISMIVMIVAVGIVDGFRNEVKNKVIGFSGHIDVRNLDLNQSRESVPIDIDQPFIDKISSDPRISSVFPYARKAGILQTERDIEGMILKGVPSNYDWSFFDRHLVKGRHIANNDSIDSYEIMISSKVADKLQLDTGKFVDLYFIHNEQVRRRRPKVVGIYSTGLGELDKTVALTDIRVIQRILAADYNSVSGFEIRISDYDKLEESTQFVDEEIGMRLRAESVDQVYFVIFQWLKLVDSNAEIIIALMLAVVILNLITALLILIIERTKMIGVLKALGASNRQVGNVFLLKASYLILVGLTIGNGIGLLLVSFQQKYGWFKLDEETYYMSVVPIEINWYKVVFLNAGTILICMIILYIPSLLVRTVSPVKAIRFE